MTVKSAFGKMVAFEKKRASEHARSGVCDPPSGRYARGGNTGPPRGALLRKLEKAYLDTWWETARRTCGEGKMIAALREFLRKNW